jgi:septal ring factor EnvC (AmiA/AmiB activator)
MEVAMNQENQPPAALEQMETAWEVQERPFTSPTPIIGPLLVWLRTAWNSISTKWYVRVVIQQQNQFNRLTVAQFHEVEQEFEAADTRLAALDGRVVAQDHDQSDLVHDVGELTAQVVQLKRQLQRIEERLIKLEQESGRNEQSG